MPSEDGQNSPGGNNGNNGVDNGDVNIAPIAVTITEVEDVPPIVNFTLNETIDISGAQIINQQGSSADGSSVTKTTFETTDETLDPDITTNLNQVIQSYYNDEAEVNSPSKVILDEIRGYAGKIKCDSFHGKGTIEDYNELFLAASKIANETKQMNLNVDIDGFNEFASAAEDLSSLFQGFIVKLQSINIVNDLQFLRSVANALKKIADLSDVFGKFKETIIATASVQIPKSAHDAKVIVEEVMGEIGCAMNYIQHFVDPTHAAGSSAELSPEEKTVINRAVSAIENWSILCEQDVSISMSNNPDVLYIKQANVELSSKATVLRSNTSALRNKFALYKNI